MELKVGTLVQGIGGFYQVALDGGGSVTCRPRGRLRRGEVRPLAGDRVRVRVNPQGEGTIEEILPRRSQLVRPPIANVDQVMVVLAFAEPPPDRFYLDRLLVAVFAEKLDAVLCLNKMDLAQEGDIGFWSTAYRDVVKATFVVSARQRKGIGPVVECLRGRITTLAGPSGVGKSALLNAISPGYARDTGDVSRKLGRGRHTTRAVELLPLPGGGWVADTPGFSQIDLTGIEPEELDRHFPDFAPYSPACRFAGCAHGQEPGCAVREAAEAGHIQPWRYEHYLRIYQELQEAKARQYR